MKAKQILILGIVLLALLVVVLLARLLRRPVQVQIEEETLVEEFEPREVGSIEFYHGAKPGETVKLKRNGEWVVPLKYSARADKKRIDSLLKDLRGLSGEVRAQGPALFGNFEIAEDQAVHLIVKDTGGSGIAHLLIGKAGDWRTSFVRKAGSSDICIVNVAILSRLGISRPAEGPVIGFDSALWLDLSIAPDIDWKKITALRLRTPHADLSFKRVVEKDEEGKEKKVDPETARWEVATQGVSYSANVNGIRAWARSLQGHRAQAVADPARESRYGFAPTRHVATLTFEDKSTKKILVGKEAPEEDGRKRFYLKVEGEKVPFIVPEYVVERLFEETGRLLELKVLNLPEKDIKSVTLKGPHKTVVLARDERNQWHVSEPALGFEEHKDVAEQQAKRFLAFEPDDLLNLVQTIPGPQTPEYQARIELADGTARTVSVFAEIEGTDGSRCVKVDAVDAVFGVDKYTLKSLFPDLTALIKIRLADLERQKVETLQVERDKQKFTLRREPRDEDERAHPRERAPGREHQDKWTLEILGHKFSANAKKAEDFLQHFVAIWPDEVLGPVEFPKYGLDKPILTVTASDGKKTATILVGKKEGTHYYAAQKENGIVFTITDKGVETAMAKLFELATLRIFHTDKEYDSLSLSTAGARLFAKREEREKSGKKVKVWFAIERLVTEEGAPAKRKEIDGKLIGRLLAKIQSLVAIDVLQKRPEIHEEIEDYISLGTSDENFTLTLHGMRHEEENARYCTLYGDKDRRPTFTVSFLVRESLLEPIFKLAGKIAESPKIKEPDKKIQEGKKEEKPKEPENKGK